jgi:peptidoglycan/LPS O-acetylase OafA/YrhL
MDQLALGLISAIVAPTLNRLWIARDARWVRASTWAAIGVTLGLLLYYPHRYIVGPFVVGLVFTASLLWVQRPAVRTLALGRWESRLMAPLVYVGKLSFGLYLFHPITRRWVDMLLPTSALPAGSDARAVVFVAVWILGTTVLAGLSYRFFEEPLLAIARRKSRQILQPPTPAQPVEAEVVTSVAAVR